MTRILRTLAFLFLVSSGAARADEAQALVYLGETRPALVRLHVTVEGRPYQAAWDGLMGKLFAHADRNGDGSLSREEAALVPTVSYLRSRMTGAVNGRGSSNNSAAFNDLDADKDGKVTLDELKRYYRRMDFGPFQLRPAPGQGKSTQMTDTLFRLLDRDGDGKLSKEEAANAEAALHRLDLDEDEMIAADEVLPEINPYGRNVFVATAAVSVAAPTNSSFLLLGAGEPPARLTRALFDRYDKDRDGKLTRAELGLDEAAFARLDANKDGTLDAGELARWPEGPSDLELAVTLGTAQPKKPAGGLLASVVGLGRPSLRNAAVQVYPTPEARWPLASSTRREVEGGVLITHGVAQIDVRGGPSGRYRADGTRNFFLQQFRMLLKDKKDYITKAEADSSQFFGALFVFADRDGDGKLTERELNAYFDLMSQAAGCFTTLSLADHGTGLFELLDANRDGRLGPRELRTAWSRLAPWDRAGVGYLTREQIPRQFQLTLTQGPPEDARLQQGMMVRGQMASPSPAGPGRGPLWFRKMDRNGDGDVSWREWLGSEEDFRKIDTDGDGLISAEEAEKADRWMRALPQEKK